MKKQHDELQQAIINNQQALIEQLLSSHPALKNAQDDKGNTPLHITVSAENLGIEQKHEIAAMLIDHGADINIQNKLDETTLHLAAADYNQWQIAEKLITAGSDLTCKDTQGQTAFDMAEFHAEEYQKYTICIMMSMKQRDDLEQTLKKQTTDLLKTSRALDAEKQVLREKNHPKLQEKIKLLIQQLDAQRKTYQETCEVFSDKKRATVQLQLNSLDAYKSMPEEQRINSIPYLTANLMIAKDIEGSEIHAQMRNMFHHHAIRNFLNKETVLQSLWTHLSQRLLNHDAQHDDHGNEAVQDSTEQNKYNQLVLALKKIAQITEEENGTTTLKETYNQMQRTLKGIDLKDFLDKKSMIEKKTIFEQLLNEPMNRIHEENKALAHSKNASYCQKDYEQILINLQHNDYAFSDTTIEYGGNLEKTDVSTNELLRMVWWLIHDSGLLTEQEQATYEETLVKNLYSIATEGNDGVRCQNGTAQVLLQTIESLMIDHFDFSVLRFSLDDADTFIRDLSFNWPTYLEQTKDIAETNIKSLMKQYIATRTKIQGLFGEDQARQEAIYNRITQLLDLLDDSDQAYPLTELFHKFIDPYVQAYINESTKKHGYHHVKEDEDTLAKDAYPHYENTVVQESQTVLWPNIETDEPQKQDLKNLLSHVTQNNLQHKIRNGLTTFLKKHADLTPEKGQIIQAIMRNQQTAKIQVDVSTLRTELSEKASKNEQIDFERYKPIFHATKDHTQRYEQLADIAYIFNQYKQHKNEKLLMLILEINTFYQEQIQSNEKKELKEQLKQDKPINRCTNMLYYAVGNDHQKAVSHLLNAGADPHMIAAGYLDGPCHQAIVNKQIDCFTLLVATSKNQEALNQLLHFTVKSLRIHEKTRCAITKILIKAGADVNSQNDLGQTPLHIIADNHMAWSTAEQLVHQGTDLTIQDDSGKTALDIAEENDVHAINCLIAMQQRDQATTEGERNKWSRYVIAHQKKGIQQYLKKSKHLSFISNSYLIPYLLKIKDIEGSEIYEQLKHMLDDEEIKGIIKESYINTHGSSTVGNQLEENSFIPISANWPQYLEGQYNIQEKNLKMLMNEHIQQQCHTNQDSHNIMATMLDILYRKPEMFEKTPFFSSLIHDYKKRKEQRTMCQLFVKKEPPLKPTREEPSLKRTKEELSLKGRKTQTTMNQFVTSNESFFKRKKTEKMQHHNDKRRGESKKQLAIFDFLQSTQSDKENIPGQTSSETSSLSSLSGFF